MVHFFYMALHLKPTFANSVAAAQAFGTNPNTGSSEWYWFCITTILLQEYIVKADAACNTS